MSELSGILSSRKLSVSRNNLLCAVNGTRYMIYVNRETRVLFALSI